MQILGRLYLFLVVCCVLEFHKNFLECLLRGCNLMDFIPCLKQLSDFVFRVFVFGTLKQVFEFSGLFLLLGFGLKLLQFDWFYFFTGSVRFLGDFRGKLGGFCSKSDFDENFSSKCKCGSRNANAPIVDKMEENTENLNIFTVVDEEVITDYDKECDADEKEYGDKVEEFDITELKKLVKIERNRANVAYAELEKERAASATAAEETMAMILRLQNEKSLIEIEANQYRKLAEKMQLHDQEVIRSLKWLLLSHSSENNLLVDQLRLCRRKLKHFVKNDECEGVEEGLSSLNLGIEDAIEDVFYSSLDMNLLQEN